MIKELSSALEKSKLKVITLETMIKVAEDNLKIKIRKKSGTKQSKELGKKNQKATLENICALFGVTRQAFYDAQKQEQIITKVQMIALCLVRRRRRMAKKQTLITG